LLACKPKVMIQKECSKMRVRKCVIPVLVIVLIIIPLVYVYKTYGDTATTISVTVNTNPTSVGQTFVASINIDDANNLWAWTATVSWNPLVLNATKDAKGPFLTQNGDSDAFMNGVINNDKGTIMGGPSQTLLVDDSVSGSGVLASVSFIVVGTGTSNISLSGVKLYDPTMPTHVALPFVLAPSLSITIPSANSSPSPTTTPTPTAPSGSQGQAKIQVFTDKIIYAPGELVHVYANVTSDGAGVGSKDVAFTVREPNNSDLATLVNQTDTDGIANINFRIPVVQPDPQAIFGNWSILVAVDVSEVNVNATTTFAVGYSIIISNISIPASVHRSSSIPINVTLQILGPLPKGLTLTESILDSAEVPLGTFAVAITTANQSQTSMKVTSSIPIPAWAFTGSATLYVNVLTAMPDAGGVPYCAQKTAQFMITS